MNNTWIIPAFWLYAGKAAAVNMALCRLQALLSVLRDICSEMKEAESYGDSIFNLRSFNTLSVALPSFYSPRAVHKGSSFSISLSTLFSLCVYVYNGRPNEYKVISHRGLGHQDLFLFNVLLG